MLLFQKRFHQGLVSGAVTLTFRAWDKPRVKVGGRYRVHPIGVVEVDEVAWVQVSELSEPDALKAGFDSLEAMQAYMEPVLGGRTRVLKIRLRHGGDGDRVSIALDSKLTPADLETLRKRLARLDAMQRWTYEVMRLIARRPRVAASKLAKTMKRETLELKADIRKLKRLGLTQSFEVGYELSPRGKAFLKACPRRLPSPGKR